MALSLRAGKVDLVYRTQERLPAEMLVWKVCLFEGGRRTGHGLCQVKKPQVTSTKRFLTAISSFDGPGGPIWAALLAPGCSKAPGCKA